MPETRPLTALEALAQAEGRRLMLLGAPGSGKSTFVNHLVLCLAGAALRARRPDEPQPEGGWLACLPGWSLGALLPIRLILRDFAAYAPLAQAGRGSLALLLEFVRQTLGAHAEALELLTDALTAGRAVLLLDGLDEVVGEPALTRVAESIAAAAGAYTRSLVLVTCRMLDYQANPRRQLRGFPMQTLAALSNQQIERFVDAWYAELAATGRQILGNAPALRQAIAARPELRDLARLPLLLTMMAVVHAGKGTLPDARALLYYECIDLLLLRWRQEPGQMDVLEQLRLPPFRAADLLALMARLGFAAHEQATRGPAETNLPADLSKAQVQAILEQSFAPYSAGDPIRTENLSTLLLHAIATRNGLLLKRSAEQGEAYAFPHRSFQEFLAGYHLSRDFDYDRLCIERAPQIHWHEALRLMVSYQVLANNDRGRPLLLAEQLLARGPTERVLAGELLNLVGRERAADYRREFVERGGLWPRARAALLPLAARGRAPEAPATLRVRAGFALSALCYGPLDALCRPAAALPMPDPRLPLAVIGLPQQRHPNWKAAFDTYWCPVAAGRFWYGDDSKEQLEQVTLPYAFKIARYPVTNADYARFVAAGGYDPERPWWTAHGRAFLQPGGHDYPWEDNTQPITLPRLWDDPQYNSPTQPVVGVSWYEAAAYCAWLTAQGQQVGWLPKNEVLRLPTSLEWERAARHIDKRRYPWGDDAPDAERANYAETSIGRPSPIGCFPAGAAMCGALDMVGNVWEWMATPYSAPQTLEPQKDFTPEQSILLACNDFTDEKELLCCGARNRFNPFFEDYLSGFRIVWSLALIV